MSKAFTKEDDAHEPVLQRAPVPLPPGVKNYLTADGAVRLQRELEQLVQERAKADHVRDLSTSREQRISQLDQSLRSAEVVEGSTGDDRVRFGAFVKVRTRAGREDLYRIVGVDETDVDRGWVSWRSPIARALLNARHGQKVKLQLPGGIEELEIIAISYDTSS